MVPPRRHPVKRGNRNDFCGSFLVHSETLLPWHRQVEEAAPLAGPSALTPRFAS